MSEATAPRGIGAGYTILVVDDDPRIVELLHIALGAHGFRVLSGSNGDDALRLAFQEQPDLLILDVRMPRRSGYEVCRAIRREPDLSHLPVIMVSALSDTEARLQGLDRGADDYLTKPFSPKELIAKVRRCLERAEEVKGLTRRCRELGGELERAREELRRSKQELVRERKIKDAHDRLAKDLARASRSDEVASNFLFSLMTHLSAQVAVLLASRADRPELLVADLSRGLGEERQRGLAYEQEGELARLLVALDRPVRAEELERFPEMRSELPPLVAAGVSLLVPVVARGRLQAVALLGEKSDPAPYTGLDLEMAANLGQAAALALEQAGLLRHAEVTYRRALRAYVASIHERDPRAVERARAVASVAERLGGELGLDETAARNLGFEALACTLDDEAAPDPGRAIGLQAFAALHELSALESEIVSVARAFVELLDRLDVGLGASQIVAHLHGDRQVLRTLEELLAREEITPGSLPAFPDVEAPGAPAA